ncbi:MAG: MBOAT family O-acyltransferase [Odoribacter sp.]
MLFNSIEFLLFLPIVFILYWYFLNKKLQLQNLFIVIVSYIFYGWWDWTFLLLIFFTSICSYFSGLLIDRYAKISIKRGICAGNIILNLSILGVYKYYDFFVDSFILAFHHLGIHLSEQTLGLVLPVGISFYTFQALSYTIDVFRKKLSATTDIISFFAYISFFPQLVAGPIERATNLLPQFNKKRIFQYDLAVDGMQQILWGFFKKIVIADNCAKYVNIIFQDYQSQSGATLLLGAIFFTFQIYGDFSGYSDIAVGTAKLFGIRLMQNFRTPYFSRDIAEFWRKWHISLTTWFRDYVYIPLGGSRVGQWKIIRNTFIIFLLSGLWHGANWTFVMWGMYHALLFVPLLLLRKNRKNIDVIAQNRIFPTFIEFSQMVLTFILVVFGWIIFRAENISQAYYYIQKIFTKSLFEMPDNLNVIIILMIVLMLIVEWINRNKEFGLQIAPQRWPALVNYSIYFALCFLIYFCGSPQETFIYFQF